MHLRSVICAGILLCVSVEVIAQNLITAYSVEEGLPQSTVMALYRDNDGYLWCGTGSGLGLYDGWEFHKPVTDSEKANPNLNSPVRGIISSTDQKSIWVGTESVLMQFDRYNYHIKSSFDIVKSPGVAEIPVFANDTAVWLLCWGNGLYRVRINDGKVTQLTKDSFVDHYGLAGDNQTIVFPDTSGNFIIYNLLTNNVKRVMRPAGLNGITTGLFIPLNGSTTELVGVTSRGLWKINITSAELTPYGLGDPSYNDSQMDFRGIAVHPDGSWWLAVMDQGVYRYDPVTRKLRPCMWQQDGTFMGDLMRVPKSIMCDAYGVVWLATDGSGLVKLLHNRVTFKSKFLSPVVTDTCNWFIRSFYELSPGRYLVGTHRNGLQLVDERANKITHITKGPLWSQQTPHFITESGDGRLVIGTEHTVLLLDTNNWSTQEVAKPATQADQRYVGYIRLSTGELLIYGNTGLHKLIMGATPSLGNPLGKLNNITSGIQLKDGRIIVATYYEGLQEVTPGGVFVKYYAYENDIGISNTTLIHGMFEDEYGVVWMGSQAGLHRLNADMRLLGTWTTENGLPDNTIYDVIALNSSTMAIATGHGMCLLNAGLLKLSTYSGEDGLPSEECNTGALLFSPSRQLYIGTTEGFVRWDPLAVLDCYRATSVLVSYGENEDTDGIIRESIVRDYGSGPIELRLWLTDFAFPDRALYSYQLEGADTGVTAETGLRKVNYAALGSGFYSFLCTATVPGCGPTRLEKLLTIKIVPPYWMSGWFIAITSMGIIVILTLILFVLMRMNYQRKIRKLKMQQELDRVRQRISRDIHDEIGAGLTRIALSGDLMSQKAGVEGVSADKLKWIAGTARELSQSMKEVVWSVNPHYDSLDHMAAYFRSYVSGVAENADIRFVYKSDEKFPSIDVNPETRRNLLLILKEVISNSMKYAQPTELSLEIHWKDETYSMTIGDNGKGFDITAGEKINSNGLRNIRQRAEASGCLLSITTAPGKGTSVKISGPISK